MITKDPKSEIKKKGRRQHRSIGQQDPFTTEAKGQKYLSYQKLYIKNIEESKVALVF